MVTDHSTDPFGLELPILACQGIARIQALHKRAVYHNLQVAVSRIEDGTGIPEAATLPIVGRSVKTNLESTSTTVLEFGFHVMHMTSSLLVVLAQFVVYNHLFLKRKIWNIGCKA